MSGAERPTHPGTPATGAHMLGPHVVGQRVVVRRLLRGLTGPTGGPAMTDVLGTCELWADGRCLVRRESGELVEVPIADIVSGKPVPPRPSRFSRLSAAEVERRAAGLFRPGEALDCGGWVFRWSGGAHKRASSILAAGEPEVPLEELLGAAEEFYGRRSMRPLAQVALGSWADEALSGRGWTDTHPGSEGVEVHLAGVAALCRRLDGVDTGAVVHESSLSRAWLVGNERALARYEAVEPTLRLDEAVFASVLEGGRQVARGRTNVAGEWSFFADLTVQPAHRRRGLAHVVMADAARWAAERGATVMLLQVSGGNEPALRLYESLGFERHHRYRYLEAP
ncbi:MAG TPA: GNAT family N-acetyltransferase [Marmoricola sp.]|nr:GNAT family N-acetyltransferase [Marmoricola sp.]